MNGFPPSTASQTPVTEQGQDRHAAVQKTGRPDDGGRVSGAGAQRADRSILYRAAGCPYGGPMGLFDELTGTEHPDSGVAPRSAEEVRAVLLGLFGADAPYVVRGGAPEGADLVAEWRVREPAWHTFFARTQVSRVLQIHLRLAPDAREVRSIDRQFGVTWLGGHAPAGPVGRGRARAGDHGVLAPEGRARDRRHAGDRRGIPLRQLGAEGPAPRSGPRRGMDLALCPVREALTRTAGAPERWAPLPVAPPRRDSARAGSRLWRPRAGPDFTPGP